MTIEENAIMGGAGSGVLEALQQMKQVKTVLQIGLPDQFIKHGDCASVKSELKIDAKGIVSQITDFIEN